MAKRQSLREAGKFSVPDEIGARVAILVPFIDEIVYADGDKRENFEAQTAELMARYQSQEREPYAVMGATPNDFEAALGDKEVATIVVEGFGNFSAVAVPFVHDRAQDMRYGYLDWQHIAGMATHLKLGEFVMYTCCGFLRPVNPPLGFGAVESFKNIRAPMGLGIQATGLADNDPLVLPITTEDELSYDTVKALFQPPEDPPLPLADALYVAARGVYHNIIDPRPPRLPRSTPIPTPDDELKKYLVP